jgi:AraC family transcriptional regulator
MSYRIIGGYSSYSRPNPVIRPTPCVRKELFVAIIEQRGFGVYYGQNNQALMAGGFRFTESRYQTDEKLPAHEHLLPHFCYVQAGAYEETLGGKVTGQTFSREPMSLLYLPANLAHKEVHNAPGRHFMIEATAERLEGMNYDPIKTPQILPPEEPLFYVARMLREYISPMPDSEFILEGLGLILYGWIQRAHHMSELLRQRSAWLRKLHYLLDNEFLQTWTLDALSQEVGLDPEHLTSRFAHAFGLTPAEFLRRRRIRYACQLMAKTGMSPVEIALQSGFADQAHFSRTFRYYMGVKPTDFMRSLRGLQPSKRPLKLRRARKVDPWDEFGERELKPLLPGNN